MPAFQVGQKIEFINPAIGEPVTWMFRGQDGDQVVVYNPKSGGQFRVPLAWVTTKPTEPEVPRCDYCENLQAECTCEN